MSTDTGGTAAAAPDDELSPGEHLRAEIERLSLDQIAVSQATGVSRQSINNIVNGRQPISRAMAAKLGRLTGRSSDYWLREKFPRLRRVREREKPPTDGRPFGIGLLVNHQITRAVKDGVIGIDPFDEKNVHLASIDLTLDNVIITTDGEKIEIGGTESFILKAGRAVNVSTRERIELPRDYIGRAGAMASLASIGIMTLHGLQIDPGFKGNLQFCIFNAGARNFVLRSGMPIISLEILPLSVAPAHDARADRHIHEAAGREEVVAIFRNDLCNGLIREAVRGRASAEMADGGVKATISDLNIEIFDTSADAALDAAVQSALDGLTALRDNPNAAREDREAYATFFGEIAARLYLSGEQARRALARLGLSNDRADTLIPALRNGGEAVIPLPTNSARISLRHFARRLREEPLDLILILAGLRDYAGEN